MEQSPSVLGTLEHNYTKSSDYLCQKLFRNIQITNYIQIKSRGAHMGSAFPVGSIHWQLLYLLLFRIISSQSQIEV